MALSIVISNDVVVLGDGKYIVGGVPRRVLTLSDRGRALLGALANEGEIPVAPSGVRTSPEGAFLRRLLDAGFLHPRWSRDADPRLDRVAVVIPVRDPRVPLELCLQRLAGLEAIVIDDCSHLPVLAGPGAEARVIRSDLPLGPSAARNLGLRAVIAEFVVFLDSDCVPEGDWLAPLLRHFADPTVAAVGPRVRAWDSTSSKVARYEASESPLNGGPREGYVGADHQHSYLPSAALVVRRAAALAVGGFDERLNLGEDVDFVWRLLDNGWRVRYEPSSTVRHADRVTFKPFVGRRYQYGVSAGGLGTRHGNRLSPFSVTLTTGPFLVLALRGEWPLACVWSAAGIARIYLALPRRLPRRLWHAFTIGLDAQVVSGAAFGRALLRFWQPVLLASAVFRSSWLRRWLALWIVGTERERRQGSDLPLAAFLGLRLAEDGAYGLGIIVGSIRERTLAPMLPTWDGVGRGTG